MSQTWFEAPRTNTHNAEFVWVTWFVVAQMHMCVYDFLRVGVCVWGGGVRLGGFRELIYEMKGQWVMAKNKRWSLPLSQAASSFLCDLWCLLPQPKGGRAKLLSTGRMFESHPREKGEKPPLQSPNTETRAPAKTRRLRTAFTRLLCVAFCPFMLVLLLS